MTMAVGLAIAGFAVVAWVISFVLLRFLWGLAGHSYDEMLASGSNWGLVWPFVAAVALMVIGYVICPIALKRLGVFLVGAGLMVLGLVVGSAGVIFVGLVVCAAGYLLPRLTR